MPFTTTFILFFMLLAKENFAQTLPKDLPLNCAEADGCRVLDGITNISFTSGFIEYIPGSKHRRSF